MLFRISSARYQNCIFLYREPISHLGPNNMHKHTRRSSTCTRNCLTTTTICATGLFQSGVVVDWMVRRMTLKIVIGHSDMSFHNDQSQFITIVTSVSSTGCFSMMAKCIVQFEVLQISQQYLSQLRFIDCPSSNFDLLQLFRQYI